MSSSYRRSLLDVQSENGSFRRVGAYNLTPSFSQGAFGKVYLGYHRLTGVPVSVKALDKKRLCDKDDVKRVTSEITLHKQLSHRHVVRLLEVIDTNRHIYMVLEHCSGGELFELIESSPGGRMSEAQLRPLARQLISAVAYMHSIGVIHRDIKAENILLDATHTQIKLIDLGLAAAARSGRLLKTACGSPFYAAPELLNKQPYSGPAVDCWAIGVVLFTAATGVFPFAATPTPGESQRATLRRLYATIRRGAFTTPSHISSSCADLIASLLDTDTSRRMTAQQALNHPFLVNEPPLASNTPPPDGSVAVPGSRAPTPPLIMPGTGSGTAESWQDATALLYGLPLSCTARPPPAVRAGTPPSSGHSRSSSDPPTTLAAVLAAPPSPAAVAAAAPPSAPRRRGVSGFFRRRRHSTSAKDAALDASVLTHAAHLLGCDEASLARAVRGGRHNHHTATYWLLLIKYEAAELECTVYEERRAVYAQSGDDSMTVPTTCTDESVVESAATAASPPFIFIPAASGSSTPIFPGHLPSPSRAAPAANWSPIPRPLTCNDTEITPVPVPFI